MALSFMDKLRWGASLAQAASRGLKIGDSRPLLTRIAEFYQQEGRMLKLDIDSTAKQVRIEVQLKDQPKPLVVRGVRYRVIGEPGARRMVFDSIELSEKWLEPIVGFFQVADRGAPIPPDYEDLVDLVL